MSYVSLFAALRRGVPGLSPCAAVILERALKVSRGADFYAGAGEMADWLGNDDRRHAQRIRRWLIDRSLLIDVEHRHRENGADSSLLCRFADSVLAIYRSWRDALTTKRHRADDEMSPAIESEAKREDSDSKFKREAPVRREAPPDDLSRLGSHDPQNPQAAVIDVVRTITPHDSSDRRRTAIVAHAPGRHAEPAEGPNPFARANWLKKLNSFVSTRLSGPQQWLGWELIAKAEKGALIDRAERRQLDDIDRAMRACGYRLGAA